MTLDVIPRYGPARAVYDALKRLQEHNCVITVDQITLYTGLAKPEVIGVLLRYRYSWVDLIDYIMSASKHNEIGVWHFQGKLL